MRTKNNSFNIVKKLQFESNELRMTVTARLDDQCSNGHCDFSLTYMAWERTENSRWVESFGGAAHDDILKKFPKLKPIADLHLCTSEGKPMYWLANGSFRIEQFLGIDQFKPENKDYKAIIMDHFRISEAEFSELISLCSSAVDVSRCLEVKGNTFERAYLQEQRNTLKEVVKTYCETHLFDRWQKEANEAIELLNSL